MAEKIHMVPVPESALPAVYALLAKLTSSGSENIGADSDSNATGWSVADIQELARMMKNQAGRAMLTLIAKRSTKGKTATYEELRVAAGKAIGGEFTYSRVQAQLSWFAKYCKKLKGENIWPLEVGTARDDVPKGERYTYSMDKATAKAWLDAV